MRLKNTVPFQEGQEVSKMGSHYKTDALVLRSRDYGEGHQILTLFTRARGKVGAIAKGVRKPKSRSRGAVQWLNFSRFELYAGRSLHTVIQGESLESFRTIKENLEKLALALYLTELLDEMVPEEEINEEAFLLLLTALQLLNYGMPELTSRMLFEIQLLKVLGYHPRLKNCHCGVCVEGKQVHFGINEGGVLCWPCARQDHTAVSVNAGAIALWGKLAETNFRLLSRLRITGEHGRQLKKLLGAYLYFYLEKELKSIKFLQNLEELSNVK